MPTGKCAKPIWEPMSSLLSVESLSVRYGRVHAVRGASVTVADGEIVAVLGAAVFTLLPELLRGSAAWRYVIFACLIIAIMSLRPRGVLLRKSWFSR